jgi:acyl carrier protein
VGRVSALFLTTALFNQMAREAPSAFGSLRRVLFGGEAVDPQWVGEVLAQGPPGKLLHVYGPTEATTFSTWHEVAAVAPGARTIPIGRTLSNGRTFVVDTEGRPVPVGVAGELQLGGAGLARGYEGRPDLTAESFVPDGCGGGWGERLYRTGDVAGWTPGGSLEFLGRRDQQVKVRGFRIELTEIESVLAEHPSVEQAVVLARQVESEGWSDRQLVAFVVAAPAAAAAATSGAELSRELRRHVGSRLPSYMVPSLVHRVAELPLSPTGKVNRRALLELLERTPGTEDLSGEGEWTAPRTPYEELLAQIWGELLGRQRIGVDEDFFELGGHSLLATQVVSRICEAFQVDLPLRTLFENPTVERLARCVEEARLSGLHAPAPPIEPAPRDADLSLSFAQERLWLIDQMSPGSPLYNVPVLLELSGELSLDALALSLS